MQQHARQIQLKMLLIIYFLRIEEQGETRKNGY